MMNKSRKANSVMTPFWLVIWSCTLAVGWLLPNHYRPWVSFHSDAWIASAFLLAAVSVIWRSRGLIQVHTVSALVALLTFVPWVQFGFGLILQTGVAWISSAYLLGLLMALLVGTHWESDSPGQLGDALFFSIGMAAILSVGLQLHQWFQLDGFELWKLGGGAKRPHANLGQPNQLGTLLLWGVLASAWGHARKHISGGVAVLIVVYLLFGVALTGSRTGWIGVALLVASGWFWRRHLRYVRMPWIIMGLGLYFAFCVVIVSWLNQGGPSNVPLGLDDLTRMNNEIRPVAWFAFLDAAWQRPIFGYGWNQVVLAQMAVATEHPYLPGFFIYSHNLFLDLVLWCGIPLGLMVSGTLIIWFWRHFRAVDSEESAVLVLFLLVVANHSMLELPLHFAYFLLPVGLVMGALDARMGGSPVISLGRQALGVFWLVSTMLLCLIIRDYARVESSYQILRLEWSRIKISIPVGPPDVLLLTQWSDYIKFARMEPKRNLGEDELTWMRNITGLFPGVIFFHKFATVLAFNHRPEEAQLWLKRMCKSVPESECRDVQTIWARQSLIYPEIAATPWPIKK